jgi:carboxymethylenebutenolidase
MCFDLTVRPPLPPIAGAAADARELTLQSADGASFRAYAARASQTSGAGMLVLPDVRGLHPYYEELALRFAEAGIDAIAIDYFGRTAGLGRRDDPEFNWMEHVQQTATVTLDHEIAAAAAYLQSQQGGGSRALFSVGFCFGGRLSFLQATSSRHMAGVIGFYGWPVGPLLSDLAAPLDVAPRFKAPVLAIYGGGDERIPQEHIDAFDAALTQAGVEHETVVYPNAPHSFFDRTAEQWADASADSWRHVLDFVKNHG